MAETMVLFETARATKTKKIRKPVSNKRKLFIMYASNITIIFSNKKYKHSRTDGVGQE
jgi:hypothetical protein